MVSDPVALKTGALANVVVSIYVPGDSLSLSVHALGVATTQIAPGNQTAAASLPPGGPTNTMRLVLTGIDVSGGPRHFDDRHHRRFDHGRRTIDPRHQQPLAR